MKSLSFRGRWKEGNKIITYLGGFIVLGSGLLVSYNVVMRYFFNNPLIWISDIVPHLQLHVTFLAACWVMINDGHIRMDLVLTRLPAKPQNFVRGIGSILAAAYCFLFTYSIGIPCWQKILEGTIYVGALSLLQWPILIVMPFGSFLLGIELILQIKDSFTMTKEKTEGVKF